MAACYFCRWSGAIGCLSSVLLAAVLSLAGDDEPKADDNPYLPREGLTADELREFIDRMQHAPKTVQLQPGFAEAIGVATDRILAAKPSDELRAYALVNKMHALHRAAMYGDETAQKKLMELAKESKDIKDKELAKAVAFYLLEDRAREAGVNGKTEDLPAVLEDLKRFFAAQAELDRRHLRLASATVKIINRLADDGLAAKSYKEFGEIWGKTQELELARYGRKIAKGTRKKAPDIIGKPMPIAGIKHDGKPFDIAQFRGKPVVVIFWAASHGPCRAVVPEFKAIYKHFHDDGLEIVGLSKDEDQEALSAYLEQEQIAWPNLFDTDPNDPEKHPVADTYGVHGIPSTFLLDRSGKVIAKDLHGEKLAAKIEELLDRESSDTEKKADQNDSGKKNSEPKSIDTPTDKKGD